MIAQAVEQAVSLFRAFDFLDASGNLMVIFSDGEDAEVTESGRTIDDVLSDAVKAKVPVYFVRISKGNTKLPDALWQRAIAKTGGRFYTAVDEAAVLRAIREIDRVATGTVEAREYSAPAAALCAVRAGRGVAVDAGGGVAAAGAAVPHVPVGMSVGRNEGVRVMRSAVGYLVVALVLFVGGRVLFGASSLEQRTADAEQALLTLRYGDLDETYEALATEAADRAPMPRVSQALVASLRAQQSTTRYWLGAYGRLEPQRDAAGALAEADPLLLELGAHAAYRTAQNMADQGAAVKRIDDIVRAYTDVVRAPAGRRDRRLESRVRVAGAGAVRAEPAAGLPRARDARPGRQSAARPDPARRAGRTAAGRRHEAVQGGGADAARRAQAAAAGRQRRRAAQEARG